MAILIAFIRNGALKRVETVARGTGIGTLARKLLKTRLKFGRKIVFVFSNSGGGLSVCSGRLVRRRMYAGIDTGEQPMNMTMIRKCAARVGVVALCSAALSSVPMMAQGGGGQGGGGGMMAQTSDQRVARLDAAVGPLTDDQKTKIKAIYDADAKKRTDLMAANDPDAMTKMRAMMTDERTQIRALLTPDQQTKFDAMPQGRGGRGGGAPGGGAPPAAPPQ
jgi:periplasmic protein CpxP/Spy